MCHIDSVGWMQWIVWPQIMIPNALLAKGYNAALSGNMIVCWGLVVKYHEEKFGV